MSLMLKLLAGVSRGRMLWGRAAYSARLEKSQRADFYRELWTQAAAQVGATVESRHGELLVLSRHGVTTKVFRNYTDLDGPVTLRAAGNKPLVHEALRARGIRTPEFRTFTLANLATAAEFLQTHGRCVVKPAAGTGAGAGVTTGIATLRQLRSATLRAAAYGSELLIENQVAGRNVRLLFLDGQLLDAVERCPPRVVGDGKATVAQLVQRENQLRRRRGSQAAQVFLRFDLDMQRTLASQGITWREVPAKGRHIQLKTVINDNAASENVCVAEEICEQLLETGRRAASAIGVRLAGVDIVTSDLSVDLSAAGGVVLEINTAPGLYIHKEKRGECVAVPILEACLERARIPQEI